MPRDLNWMYTVCTLLSVLTVQVIMALKLSVLIVQVIKVLKCNQCLVGWLVVFSLTAL